MPEFLYHVTSESALESILKDKVLKPGAYMKEVYFSDNVKDCLSLTGRLNADSATASYWNSIFNNKKHICQSLVRGGVGNGKTLL